MRRPSITEQVCDFVFVFLFPACKMQSDFRDKNIKITIYTGDVDAKPKTILTKARNTFNVAVNEDKVDFVFLTRRNWVEAEKYPYFTLLGQSLGSVWLGLEALLKHQPGMF